jgi:hypothetical protein
MSLHSPKTLGFSTLLAKLDIVDNINYIADNVSAERFGANNSFSQVPMIGASTW